MPRLATPEQGTERATSVIGEALGVLSCVDGERSSSWGTATFAFQLKSGGGRSGKPACAWPRAPALCRQSARRAHRKSVSPVSRKPMCLSARACVFFCTVHTRGSVRTYHCIHMCV